MKLFGRRRDVPLLGDVDLERKRLCFALRAARSLQIHCFQSHTFATIPTRDEWRSLFILSQRSNTTTKQACKSTTSLSDSKLSLFQLGAQRARTLGDVVFPSPLPQGGSAGKLLRDTSLGATTSVGGKPLRTMLAEMFQGGGMFAVVKVFGTVQPPDFDTPVANAIHQKGQWKRSRYSR